MQRRGRVKNWGFNQPFSHAHLYRWIQKRGCGNAKCGAPTPGELASEAARSIRAAVLAMLSARSGLELLNARYKGIHFIRKHGKGLRAVFANSFDSGHPRFGRGKWLDEGRAGPSSDVLFLWEPRLYVPVRPSRDAPSEPSRQKRVQNELWLLDQLVGSTKASFSDLPVMAFRALDPRQPADASSGGTSWWTVPDGAELRRVSKASGPAISESTLSPLVSFFYATSKVTTTTTKTPSMGGRQLHRWYIIGPGRVAVVIRKTRKQ